MPTYRQQPAYPRRHRAIERRKAQGGGQQQGGEQRTPLFFSDWRTATLGLGDSGLRPNGRSDNGKWSISRWTGGTIIEAPAEWPCHQVTRIGEPVGVPSNSYNTSMTKTGLGLPAIGTARNYRFYWSYLWDMPTHPFFHGIADHHAEGSRNWEFTTPDSDIGGTHFGVAFKADPDSPNDKWGHWNTLENDFTLVNIPKNVPMRWELQLFRTGASTCRYHLSVFDGQTDELLLDDADWRNTNNTADLSSDPTQDLPNVNTLDQIMFGHNGIANDPEQGHWHSDQGCVAVVDGLEEEEFIGAYGTVEGEVPR